ncbi:SDR family NAD(P)-dependent oxidoreductase [Saccharopolyspora mangrovi]|uniref:SDR family oxidoreductase n=1 Tax=Saccharopolyspora mangrovi TaxID=3082379 RepID=A0ABU6A4S4_9PSEU|nr:SDR family oxidoreductase [Saccharopolyspora sp. S2-29]MEB3366437.1 SDR family oxidoreductase [Saccharopolyspora sp. S2-29]
MTFDPTSAFDLSGRVAMVTGGSRGLGKAIALGLARAGADVIISSRKQEACEEAAAEVERETGRRAHPISAHVGRWDRLDGLVDDVYQRVGRVDVLVNNAGMSPLYDSVEGITEELFDKVIAVNLKGPFRLSALVGSRMAESGGGSIINISSAAATRPRPSVLPYAAAKAGLNAITTGFAHTFGPSVRCNAIMAGTFHTDVSASWDPAEFAARAQRFALQRGGRPDEIVGMAVYLASEASSYTTGAVLAVDGGQP